MCGRTTECASGVYTLASGTVICGDDAKEFSDSVIADHYEAQYYDVAVELRKLWQVARDKFSDSPEVRVFEAAVGIASVALGNPDLTIAWFRDEFLDLEMQETAKAEFDAVAARKFYALDPRDV